ncbi:MAG TPA: ATP synthase F1 subunit epsilon [Pyrinomonadaceae bacterium]|nr:ATP synthase F1 subunit epsilon [Pyrinomonadaceae bacterium]HMP66868.1 ATP synthase F1 subunit epsilon [Pyrinomonadaceae bacterium]
MLKLEIVTPERKVIDAEVDSVTVPTLAGEAGIMPQHAPLISALKPGIVTVLTKGKEEKLAVSTGFVEVSHNRVSVLTDVAETAEDIDADAAKLERADAEKELTAASSMPEEETEELRQRLDLASARVAVKIFADR